MRRSESWKELKNCVVMEWKKYLCGGDQERKNVVEEKLIFKNRKNVGVNQWKCNLRR